MFKIIMWIGLPVHHDTLDVTVRRIVRVSMDSKSLSVFQMYLGRTEIRCTDHIPCTTRTDWIEAECRKDIPGRSLPIILVATISVGLGRIEAVHHLTHPVLSLPGLSAVVVKVNHVLDGLVAMRIVAHVHNLHLTYLVDGEAVLAVVEDGREVEHTVQHDIEPVVPTH